MSDNLPGLNRPGTSGPTLTVVGAAIIRDGLVFCTQRGPGGPAAGQWEFPGGKVEPGERPAAALARELREELHVAVVVGDVITTTVVGAGGNGDDSAGEVVSPGTTTAVGQPKLANAAAAIALTTYFCRLAEGPEPTLTEHVAARWLPPQRLAELDWAVADLPTVAILAGACPEQFPRAT